MARVGHYSELDLTGTPTTEPASKAQTGMWLASEVADESDGFIVVLAYHMRGHLDVARLGHALNSVIQRHAALRSTFGLSGDALVRTSYPTAQLVLQPVSTPHPRQDGLDLMRSARHTDWGVLGGSLVRCVVATDARLEHFFALLVHHTVFDSASAAIVLRELEAFYAGRDPSGAPCGRYDDFVEYQSANGDRHDIAGLRAEWARELRGVRSSNRVARCEPQGKASVSVERTHADLSPAAISCLFTSARNRRTTPFTTLLARLAVGVSRLEGSSDVTIGTAVSTRVEPEWEKIVGLFADFVPLRVRFGAGDPLEVALSQITVTLLRALRGSRVSFSDIVTFADMSRGCLARPFFHVYATQEHDGSCRLALGGVRSEPVAEPSLQQPSDCACEIVLDKAPGIAVTFRPDYYAREEIAGLMGVLTGEQEGR